MKDQTDKKTGDLLRSAVEATGRLSSSPAFYRPTSKTALAH